ncbi:acyl-coenzyme A thioesterase 9, mitochondrial isoform X1 [Dromiciops gliroides]|nr:acyl-coenzyme A thioesterase 9, mitochondrial isoform X1 [Dromiciops gliroides]XP_043853581.1 acyl-coenzyme A thioesterase 9, mitochondrial isoform X1 [Dromiciops gliroides]XP_043853582.1 acyl-coenzyme A thioesterase 9, mitochondrial isoform X1 [Dromiciops gliroides]
MTDVRYKLLEVVGASSHWCDHVKSMEERKLLHSLLPKNQKELPPRRMKDSYIEAILPLGTQTQLREKYLTVYNSVRFGRILEDLDSLGVLICYTHTKIDSTKISPFSIVTALVDKIDLCQNVISPERDIKFTGHVSWVGKTSMEVKMHMSQLQDTVYHPVLDATFVMVARDPENKGPAFINPLVPEGPEEEELFKQGELNKRKRVASRTASLLKMAPTAEERNAIHDLFLNTLDPRTISFQSRVLPPNSVWMEDTKLKSLHVCHPEKRNIYNRIFGGFLMRKAFELGWATACNFGASRPFPFTVDDIMFQRPVEIGSLLYFSSQVCFTEKNYIQVRVHSVVSFPGSKEYKTTNVFHFTFFVEKEVPSVVPKTYGDSMLYLDGYRRFMATMHQKSSGKSTIQ